jgi:prepilin-type N-terminal cleavage/methylation domain-containing protein
LTFRRFPAAFSLIELMIAIVILGVGLVMVATMFPVAWQRAREMSEITAQQAMVPAIESTVRGLVPLAKFGTEGCDPIAQPMGCVLAAGIAGDLIFDARYRPPWVLPAAPTGRIIALSDTRVHALHLQNVTVGAGQDPRRFVGEAPWELERMPTRGDLHREPSIDYDTEFGPQFDLHTYHTPRIRLSQRVFPPMGRRANVNADGEFSSSMPDDVWDEQFEARRFCWAVFHRLRQPVGPDVFGLVPPLDYPVVPDLRPPGFVEGDYEKAAGHAYNQPRLFDMYYVTLRRTRSTNRYARQAVSTSSTPNPYLSTTALAVPEAMDADEDVMLPVPWRVQITVPNTIVSAANATGIPTEVLVPPAGFTNEKGARMLVQMFPAGAQFIDEVGGKVYKVASRRIVDFSDDGEGIEAVLTLNREITIEDVDFQDPIGSADTAELLRTIWVFPPPAEPRDAGDELPYFDGPSPVMAIDVRTMTLRP